MLIKKASLMWYSSEVERKLNENTKSNKCKQAQNNIKQYN
jgi:hypothetical protein